MAGKCPNNVHAVTLFKGVSMNTGSLINSVSSIVQGARRGHKHDIVTPLSPQTVAMLPYKRDGSKI